MTFHEDILLKVKMIFPPRSNVLIKLEDLKPPLDSITVNVKTSLSGELKKFIDLLMRERGIRKKTDAIRYCVAEAKKNYYFVPRETMILHDKPIVRINIDRSKKGSKGKKEQSNFRDMIKELKKIDIKVKIEEMKRNRMISILSNGFFRKKR